MVSANVKTFTKADVKLQIWAFIPYHITQSEMIASSHTVTLNVQQ